MSDSRFNAATAAHHDVVQALLSAFDQHVEMTKTEMEAQRQGVAAQIEAAVAAERGRFTEYLEQTTAALKQVADELAAMHAKG